jgi:hypothetical protein
MAKFFFTCIILFTVFFTYTVDAQEYGLLRKATNIILPEKIQGPLGDPIPTGTYSIGTGGYFPTIDSAFNKLSINGIAGNVTLELIDELYVAPTTISGFFLNGPIPGAGSNSRVTIKPAENKNVIIQGSGRNVLSFMNTSFLTFDGVGLTGLATLTIHAFKNNQYGWNDCLAFLNNSDHNIVQNISFICDDVNGIGMGPGFYTPQGFIETADSNLVQNIFIKKAGMAIVVSAFNAPVRAKGNIIRDIYIGSETDSLISWGIQVENCENTIIENNIVQNIKAAQLSGDNLNLGINSYSGHNNVIRNNVVNNIRSTTGYTCVGILLSGNGSDNMIYNNMVYDIQSTSTQSNSRVAGIQIWLQTNPKIYYNTVYLSGTGKGSNPLGSAAFYVYGGWGASTHIDLKNNIFVNTRDESPYCASAIYNYTDANLTSDYNDLYYDNTNAANCMVRISSTNYHTLADWQATGKDLHSVTEMPNFIAPHLHINEAIATYLEKGATPIPGIDTDIDGDTRHSITPDIGADEFNGIVIPVELTSFTAISNGSQVILNWTTATETNNRGFEIHRVAKNDKEWRVIGYVTGYGTTTEPKSYTYTDSEVLTGKYTYRLKQIDFDGSYEYSPEVEVEIFAPIEYALDQNYPNPFNPNTVISYQLPVNSDVLLKVFDVLGKEIATLVDEYKTAGRYDVEFQSAVGGRQLASGVYFYQLKAGNFLQTRKMILLR